jgi:hypothetical protein
MHIYPWAEVLKVDGQEVRRGGFFDERRKREKARETEKKKMCIGRLKLIFNQREKPRNTECSGSNGSHTIDQMH